MKYIVLVAFSILGIHGISRALSADSTLSLVIGILLYLVSFTTAIWVKFGARWYNPATGRWAQQDTLDNPLDPKNANRYAYAGNDPINNQDPTGRAVNQCGASLFTAALGVAGLAATFTAGAAAVAAAPVTGGASFAVALAAGTGFGISAGAAVYGAGSAINSCGG